MPSNETRVKVLSSALGLGHLPIAPGTWASGGAVCIYVLLRWAGVPAWPVWLAVLLVPTMVVGVVLAPRAEKAYGREDPRPFVLDEVAGMWLTCLLFWWRGPVATAVVAFFAFRVFDVLKPPPIRSIEKLHGGWGVMLDDLAAGLFSAATLWLLCYHVLDPVLTGWSA
jgi:phosphatidylglycerophosphatase A